MEAFKLASITPQYNELKTSELDQLSELLAGKNRIYNQIKPGKLNVHYQEAWLGQAQIFCESLDTGTHIQAAPPDSLLPFAYILPSSSSSNFCNSQQADSYIAQACGGYWDVAFDCKLNYVCAAFDKEYFYRGYQQLTAMELGEQALTSQAFQTSESNAHGYACFITEVMHRVNTSPELLQQAAILRLFCSQLLSALVKVLQPNITKLRAGENLTRVQVGINRVIDYLNHGVHELPDIPFLCELAGISERSLQTGFMKRFGLTPIQYVRNCRLSSARAELQKSDPNHAKVVDVAIRWGFVELGRFARDYKIMFNELPSKTLHAK